MSFREKSVLFIATGCFIGRLPYAPGTFGTLAGLPICFILSRIDFRITTLCIVLFLLAGIWISGKAEKILKKEDPGSVVIDEIAGIMIALAGIPFNAVWVGLGVILFRLLDIVKPFPVKYIEARFSGGTGIVLDDAAAGLMTNAIIRIIMLLAGRFHFSIT